MASRGNLLFDRTVKASVLTILQSKQLCRFVVQGFAHLRLSSGSPVANSSVVTASSGCLPLTQVPVFAHFVNDLFFISDAVTRSFWQMARVWMEPGGYFPSSRNELPANLVIPVALSHIPLSIIPFYNFYATFIICKAHKAEQDGADHCCIPQKWDIARPWGSMKGGLISFFAIPAKRDLYFAPKHEAIVIYSWYIFTADSEISISFLQI